MKKMNREFLTYDSKDFNDKVEYVEYKVALLLDLKEQFSKDSLRDMVRLVFKKSGVDIRYTIDLAEDSWLDKDHIFGRTIVIVRVQSKDMEIGTKFSEGLFKTILSDIVTLEGFEYYKVSELQDITLMFDRVMYELKVDLGKEPIYSKSETSGGWRQDVLLWDGTVKNIRADGTVRVSLSKFDSDSHVYRLLVDAPYGLDVYKIVEQELELPRNFLKDYPLNSLHIYESVDQSRNYLSRPKCDLSGSVIELTVGGLVGSSCVDELVKF